MISVLTRAAMSLALIWIAGFVWFVSALPEPAPESIRTDGIVVLTGGPGRLARGVEMLRAKKAKRLLVSGVDNSVRPIDLAVELDVPEELFKCCIDLGKRAADTRGNGQEIADWTRKHDYHTIRLVTSEFHMARAQAEAEARLGDDVKIVPDAVSDRQSPKALAVEYSKYLFRRILLMLGID
jgi:uncharacterized SAM-binding protein YcdF (DUF218 family)